MSMGFPIILRRMKSGNIKYAVGGIVSEYKKIN